MVMLNERCGFDIDDVPMATCGQRPKDDDAGYWEARKDNRIYYMSLVFAEIYCREKRHVADVGAYCSPMVLLLPDFRKRFAIDPNLDAAPLWSHVTGATLLSQKLETVPIKRLIDDDRFDLIMCHQVIEHLENPAGFIRMLTQRCRRLIISTTFETPAGMMTGHIQDPISLEKFESWFTKPALGLYISRGPRSSKILGVF